MIGLEEKINQICNRAILVSGSARSGTTIMGKLLHSCRGVEYTFEPPTLYSLFALMPRMDLSHWNLLYETYLYEEFFMNSLAGRSINCNREDDSSIFRVKTTEEVADRQVRSHSKVELEARAERYQLAFKMPDIVRYLPALKERYPGTRVVAMTRSAPEVFRSLRVKGWFEDKNLQETNNIWPCYRRAGKKVPFWVAEQDAEGWLGMDELSRIAYYYLSVNAPLDRISDVIRVRYTDLLSAPSETLGRVREQLGLQEGPKTAEVIASVGRKSSRAGTDELDGLPSSLKAEVLHYSALS